MREQSRADSASDIRMASDAFASLWADQSRRAWLNSALVPVLLTVVGMLLLLGTIAEAGSGPLTLRAVAEVVPVERVSELVVDAVDASRIYIPVAAAAFTVFVTIVMFTALASTDSAERTAILLRLRSVVQMILAVGWTLITALGVLVALSGVDPWPILLIAIVQLLLTAAFATLSALYLVVGNTGMRVSQVRRVISAETALRDDLRGEARAHPLWPRVLAWTGVVLVIDVAAAFVVFHGDARPEGIALRAISIVVLQAGYTLLLTFHRYLEVRRPSAGGWFPPAGRIVLLAVVCPLLAIVAALALGDRSDFDGWAVAVIVALVIVVPLVAVLSPRVGVGGALSGVAARSLDASVQRYTLHLRALERQEAHDEAEPRIGDQSASSDESPSDESSSD